MKKEKPYRTVEARKVFPDGSWVEVVEIEGHQYRIKLVAGEPVKNPFNRQWGHRWYATLSDVTGPTLFKLRVDKGTGMLKLLSKFGVLNG